ncbi:hypothetical protein EDD86DRAFT_10919 [Gorgonomyces haynaldii]|nr:hypothetical protein EDD86DRAFT_10919 [Gorgonomyces haynaldii]
MSKLPILNIPEFSDERPKMMSRKSFVDWPKSPMTEISRLSIVNSKDSELLSEVASLVKRESTVYPGEPDRPTHMLSRESYLFLKKLLLEEGNFDSPQLFEIEEKLRSILLGAGVQDDEPLLEMVQGVENGTRAHTSHAKMTPVAIKKIADELIKSENKPVNLFKYQDAESMLPPKKEHLGLPDVESEASSDRNQSFLESRPMSVHTEAPKEVALEIEQTFGLMAPPRATTRFVIESMKEIFGDELIVPPAISATPTDTLLFTPVHVGMAPLEAPEPPNKFYKAIRKLVHEIKANIPLLQMADTNTVETGFWSSIIESDFTRLTKAPEVGSPNAEQLMKAAKAAMIQEVCPSLQYEACRLLIDSDLYTLLGRWDMYQFNQLLKVIPSQGTEDQKDSVAVYNALNGNIDKTVVDQLHKALDSHDHQRRKLAKAILSEMDGCFGELVIPVLLELGQRESWRTKMDILELFRAWIPKLIPERPPKPALRDPDALDSDSPELIKALFNTLGNFTFSQEKNEKEEIAPSKLKFETVPDFLKPKEYVDEEVVTMDATKTRLFRKCVHSLLVMMWEDHSSTVRKTATDLLAHFRQGKAVYDYIILMLSSPDPIKRANALVSLQTLEIITKDDMPSLLQVFQDAYASVRTEACKFAAILKSHEPQMISALLDQMSYPDESVRCQALRGIFIY